MKQSQNIRVSKELMTEINILVKKGYTKVGATRKIAAVYRNIRMRGVKSVRRLG